jgi:hypothetical protein
MDFWFQFALTVIRGVLAGLHVNLSLKSTYSTVLIELANGIYALYGMTPPAPPAAPTA